MAGASLQREDDVPLVAEILDVINDQSWRMCVGAQIKAVYAFINDENDPGVGTCMRTLIATMSATPVMKMLYAILQLERSTHKVPPKATDQRPEPAPPRTNIVALELASCTAVNQCLHEGAQMLSGCHDLDESVPKYIDSFKYLFVPDAASATETIFAFWRVHLPGQAQMWYRIKKLWAHTWPYRLLRLLLGLPAEAKRRIAEALLASRDCCFGSGGSIAKDIKEIALSMYATREEQLLFICGRWVRQLLRTWAAAISVSIHDLECMNAQISRSHKGGRPQNVETLSAKITIANAKKTFFRMHDIWPRNLYDEALQNLRDQVRTPTTSKRRKTSAFALQRSEHLQALADKGSAKPIGAEFHLELNLERAGTSQSMERFYNMEAHIANNPGPAHQPREATPDACQDLVPRPDSSMQHGGQLALYTAPKRHYELQSVTGDEGRENFDRRPIRNVECVWSRFGQLHTIDTSAWFHSPFGDDAMILCDDDWKVFTSFPNSTAKSVRTAWQQKFVDQDDRFNNAHTVRAAICDSTARAAICDTSDNGDPMPNADVMPNADTMPDKDAQLELRVDGDIYAPPTNFCGSRGDCTRLPLQVRKTGAHASSRIIAAFRKASALREQGRGVQPGSLPAIADIENPMLELEELSVWALGIHGKAAEGHAHVYCHYFMVAHVLYLPYRIIVLDLMAQPCIGNWRMLSFERRHCKESPAFEELAFFVLYEYIDRAVAAVPSFGWDEGRIDLNNIKFSVADWDSVMIRVDPTGVPANINSSEAIWPVPRKEKTPTGLSESIAACRRAMGTLAQAVLQGNKHGGGATEECIYDPGDAGDETVDADLHTWLDQLLDQRRYQRSKQRQHGRVCARRAFVHDYFRVTTPSTRSWNVCSVVWPLPYVPASMVFIFATVATRRTEGSDDMLTGTRSGSHLVAAVLGKERFAEMSRQHIVIAFNKSTPPCGEFMAYFRVHRTGQPPTTRALYGSRTRCHDTTVVAKKNAIWRVYNTYVRYELVVSESAGAFAEDAEDMDDVGDAMSCSTETDSADDRDLE